MSLPRTGRALVIKKAKVKPNASVYHDVVVENRSVEPPLHPGEILVKVSAVAFNHRDLWIRKGLYPGIAFDSVLGSDAVGTVIASGDQSDGLLNKRVFIVPMQGWESHPDAPESTFGVVGGNRFPSFGVFSEFVKISRDQVVEAPEHLEDHHAAAWPLAGVTAWRAVAIAADVQKGDNILITGIGGGVALIAMQLCIAKGANVYVTSGNDQKIQKAVGLGARGGVNYRSSEWPTDLARLLQQGNAVLSAIIDSGGGDLFKKVGNLLKLGGKLVCYGMTAEPKITFTMREVMKNQKLIGTTMGSKKDLIDATEFIRLHGVKPAVSVVLESLDDFEQGFQLMQRGDQFGKIVMKVHRSRSSRL
ncbi:NAD-binding protein [Sanghuangporus baumii]|uniref:NAD-binding protein n=1 Tax=Sanghuangporus baumii TaxID=108892 RepID=A0A9Q5HQZ9_SANBA|nr:NAD-binding protein [Sanghuangporus baumii]